MMEDDKGKYEKPNIKGDRLNILLLIFLYVLQNITIGLIQALPLIIQNRNVTYEEQAAFSIVAYPGCMKLLWAPIIDCLYSKKIGRRKSWLIPMQYLMGIILFLTSANIEVWLGSDDGSRKPRVQLLAAVFFMCAFFTCVQDVALDAWSLTMLKRRNIGYAGTCQNLGAVIGYFIGLTMFIILDSKDFCNMFRSDPSNHGFVSYSGFTLFWSVVIMISTTVLIFKRDNSLDDVEDHKECELGLTDSYKHLWEILKVGPIQIFIIILLTFKMGFGPINGIARLKLIDAGITQDKLVLLDIPALPFQMLLSVILSRYIAGPRSMHTFIYLYVLKLIMACAFAVVLFFIPYMRYGNNTLPVWYYCLLTSINTIVNVVKYLMGVSVGAFFVRISDPRFGGIYLTLLNTMGNIGYNWPVTLCLWAISQLSIKTCSTDKLEIKDKCRTKFDGYFTETIISTVLGVLWLFWAKKVIYGLEKMDQSSWIAKLKKTKNKKELSPLQPGEEFVAPMLPLEKQSPSNPQS